ncbi:MAG: transcription antitermination factor NusB [Candidatus Cloacimonetes bacterium]|jgi:N utilization substance protein B|nr:transcription antitermination factor NusB [Candidatus Cloacimonadota bacterium]MDY0298697.1 transcription antitermination factor NusB [Candidatus Cloacimonadaceae bacterium]MCB5278291.1 transcription antitermination factor NusB [Candidatus Cloacimonadota bacterium]MCK9332170.1 transcription antitermination factor NusB [Candidatus Cloacimonadota bacterium]MDD2210963.1 transcription antitermination factor NusB [Candidatus Cloacimonadota bacterium]
MGQRRKAREFAVQCIYALDFADVEAEYREYGLLNEYPEILRQLTSAENISPSSTVYAFADELVKNTIINIEDIEAEIDKYTEHWSLESIAHLDKSILIVAVYELMFTDTPAPVIINEGIEIAKKFCSEHTGKFINGILDAINKGIPHSMPGRQLPT